MKRPRHAFFDNPKPSLGWALSFSTGVWALTVFMWWWAFRIVDLDSVPFRSGIPVTPSRAYFAATMGFLSTWVLASAIEPSIWRSWTTSIKLCTVSMIAGLFLTTVAVAYCGYRISAVTNGIQ